MAKERPYPGSTTVTTVNGGVVGLTRTLVEELRPRRVNSIHPGSSATARTGRRSRRRSRPYTRRDADRPAGVACRTSSDAVVVPAREPGRQRRRPHRRRRLALPVTSRTAGAARLAAADRSDDGSPGSIDRGPRLARSGAIVTDDRTIRRSASTSAKRGRRAACPCAELADSPRRLAQPDLPDRDRARQPVGQHALRDRRRTRRVAR